MSPGTDLGNAYLVVNSTGYHNRLCALDVLGLEDKPTSHQSEVREEFKEQLTGSPDGRYETGLPWKGNCPELPNNCTGSVRRVNSLLRKLKRIDMLDQYDDIIRKQLEEGVVERAPAKVTGKEFYMPHQAVIRENAESTKLPEMESLYSDFGKIQLCSDVKWVIHREMWPIPTFVLIPRITMDAAYFSKAIPSYLLKLSWISPIWLLEKF